MVRDFHDALRNQDALKYCSDSDDIRTLECMAGMQQSESDPLLGDASVRAVRTRQAALVPELRVASRAKRHILKLKTRRVLR